MKATVGWICWSNGWDKKYIQHSNRETSWETEKIEGYLDEFRKIGEVIHAVKQHDLEINLRAFLASALDAGDVSISRPSCLGG
jgi:hypothetical protein